MDASTNPVWLTRWPLRYALPGVLLVLVLVGGLLTYSVEARLTRARMLAEGEQSLLGFGNLQAQALRDELLRGDIVGLRSQVAALALYPGVTSARLQSTNGAVLASTSLVELGQRLPVPDVHATRASLATSGARLLLHVPLRAQTLGTDSGSLGTLEIARDLTAQLQASDRRLRHSFARYVGYFLAIAMLLWVLLDRLAWRRLRVLGDANQRIASGDFQLRVDARGGDEVAEVARMVNLAAAELERSAGASARLRRALERLASPDPATPLFDALAAAVAEGMDSRWGLISRHGEKADEMVVVGLAGGDPFYRGMRYALPGSPCAACLDTVEGVLVVPRGLASHYPAATLLSACGAESFRGVVITGLNGEALGTLSVLDTRPLDDMNVDLPLLQTAARRIAQAFMQLDSESLLREREERLSLAMEISQISVSEWDLAGDRIEIRGNWVDRFALAMPEGHLRMQDWLAAVHPDDLPAVHLTLETLRSSAAPTGRIDYRMRARDGSWRWVSGLALVSVRDDAGAPRVVVGVQTDVHDLVAKEEALRGSEARLRLALDAGELAMALWTIPTDEFVISPKWSAMLGYAADEMPPLRAAWTALTHPDDRERLWQHVTAHLRGELANEPIEYRLRTRQGDWHWVRTQAMVIQRDAEGRALQMIGVQSDVHAARLAAEALRERTEFLELAVRGSTDGMWGWDGDVGNDLYLSPRVYELLGYAPGDIEVPLDRFEATIYHPGDQPRIRAAVTQLLEHPETGDVLSFEGRFLCANGEYRWFHNRAAVLRRPDGSLRRFAGSISDIHDRKLREQDVTAARQRLSDAMEAIDSGLMISDQDDRLVLCNRRYREMYGFAPELLAPGTPLADLVRDLIARHPDYAGGEPVEVAVAKRLEKHRASIGQWELELDGRWFQIGDHQTADGGIVSLRTDITHLKHVEQQLRERSELFEAAVRGSMDGMYDVEIVSDRAYFSPRFHELLGYADGALPDRWSAFTAAHFHPGDHAERDDALGLITQGNQEFMSREMRLRRRDGSWGWYHARALVMRGPANSSFRLVGSMSDTQARHEREEELAHARQQLQDAIESVDIGLVMFDRDERFVLCNRHYRELYGDTGVELQPGVTVEDTYRAYYLANPAHLQGRDLESCVTWRLEQYRGLRGTAEVQIGDRWMQIANYATADGGVVCLRNDITAIKRTEQALRESEARLRTVFDNSPVGIFLAGTDGAVVFRNRVFASLTGHAERESRRHAWLSHVHEDERAWIGARWYEYVSAAAGSFDIEYRTADQAERIVRLRAAPVVEQGQTLGFAGTLEDISAQRQAELEQHRLQMQLQQAQKMDAIGHLTGGIAHDFNNILASILGYAALAGERKTTLADSKLVTYLDAIRQSGERARELVAKMLAFSRSEPREVVTPTAIQPLVGEAVKLLKAIIPSNIHIVTVADPELPSVQVDGVDLHQAIVNLAVNARDAITGHGQITIGLRAPRQIKGHCASCRENFADRYVEISISDTGGGIAPEHLSRLFEPFFTTKEVGKGTGMGLAVTHGVVHRVGGHIVVDTVPGNGTTIRLMLRSGQPLMRSVPAPSVPAPLPQPKAARVLVVDDEPLVMGLIAEVLETHGYDVVGYTDARQALAWARSRDADFALLVTDQTMPGLTGVELARELLAMRPELPVILCTGFSESVDARVAAAMGIKHFFSKPIPLDRLVAAVGGALDDSAAPAVA